MDKPQPTKRPVMLYSAEVAAIRRLSERCPQIARLFEGLHSAVCPVCLSSGEVGAGAKLTCPNCKGTGWNPYDFREELA